MNIRTRVPQIQLPLVTLKVRDAETDKLLATVKEKTKRACVLNARLHYSGDKFKWCWN